LRPGIFYSDDPAFGGGHANRRRRRGPWNQHLRPALEEPAVPDLAAIGITGLNALRQRAIDGKQPFDYAHPVGPGGAGCAHRRFADKPSPRFVFERLVSWR
jgi:hypothetical protein